MGYLPSNLDPPRLTNLDIYYGVGYGYGFGGGVFVGIDPGGGYPGGG